eukprot:GHVU01013530.1.p4 GENE.GHVU01013530.1~~GHVU01013530.1.p4  ORF type:complete len:103 (-),score=7.16 GHVU01013530.1:514-822(-)
MKECHTWKRVNEGGESGQHRQQNSSSSPVTDPQSLTERIGGSGSILCLSAHMHGRARHTPTRPRPRDGYAAAHTQESGSSVMRCRRAANVHFGMHTLRKSNR